MRNAAGTVVYTGATPFLPQDPNLTSTGVIKVSDYGEKDGRRTQMGFSGFFLPTAPVAFDANTGPRSLFPGDADPALVLNAFAGDLGTDSGLPQNVYQLNTKNLTQLQQDGKIAKVRLKPGQAWDLPDGYGSVTFEGYKQWASFNVSHRPGNAIALTGGVLAILGLIGSLFVQQPADLGARGGAARRRHPGRAGRAGPQRVGEDRRGAGRAGGRPPGRRSGGRRAGLRRDRSPPAG